MLTPETQRSLIVGLKAASQNGRAEFDVDGFFVNFYNQPVEATANGTAVLRSIGEQRYKGMDVEGLLRPGYWLVDQGEHRLERRGVRRLHDRYRRPADPSWQAGTRY